MNRALLMLLLASAVAYDVRAEGSAPCAAWLTAAEVKAALNMELQTSKPVEYSPGFTVCSWTKDRPEGQLGVHFSFFEMKAIREGMVPAESISEYFDREVASKKEEGGSESQTLDGIGKRAVLFTEENLSIVMIELEEGFAHLAISPNGVVNRDQLVAMAKAAASRAKE
jgi:hypothetical protein